MKALNCRVFLTLLLSLGFALGTQAKEVKKEFKKDFNISKGTVLQFDTKFSQLSVINWDQNKMACSVSIKAEHPDEEVAKKLLSYIEVSVEQEGSEVIVETALDDKISKLSLTKNKKFEIQITIQAPSWINVMGENSFGSLIFEKIDGDISIENDYGYFEADELSGNSIELELAYGDGHVAKMSDAIVSVDYGSLAIKEATSLDIEVDAGSLKIGSVLELNAEIDKGELKVIELPANFTEATIESDMADVQIGVNKDAGFTLFAEMDKGNIDLPNALENVEKTRDKLDLEVEANYGSGESSITLEGTMGNIALSIR